MKLKEKLKDCVDFDYYGIDKLEELEFEDLKEEAISCVQDICGYIPELESHNFTTEEGYKVECSIISLNDLTWRIEMAKDSSYICLYDGTRVENVPVDVLKSVRLQMMKHLTEIFYRDRDCIRTVENAKTKKEIFDLEIADDDQRQMLVMPY